MSAVIEITNLTKRFGPLVAVDNLSFSVDEGKVCGFLGPNGAGKTTTLRSLLGLVHPTSGSATILGQQYRHLAKPLSAVGAVLETTGYHPGRSAKNHLRYLTAAAGLPKSRVDDVLELVDLGGRKNSKVGNYSMGMKQRLALAAALLADPQVLLLDEPGNGLDPQGMRWLRNFVRKFADEGRTVVISSHVLAEVAQTVDEVVIINKGRAVMQSSMIDLRSSAGERVRVRTRQPAKLRKLLDANGLEHRDARRNELVVEGATTEAVGALAAKGGIPLLELTQEGGSLEDIFFELVGAPEEAIDMEEEEISL